MSVMHGAAEARAMCVDVRADVCAEGQGQHSCFFFISVELRSAGLGCADVCVGGCLDVTCFVGMQ